MSNTKEKILNIAEELFLNKGYESVSIRDITTAAGTNVASINYHFNCKRDLYRAVFGRKLQISSDIMIATIDKDLEKIESPTLHDAIHTIVSAFISGLLLNKDSGRFLTLIMHEMSEGSIASDIFLEQGAMPIHRKLRETITRARPNLAESKLLFSISSIIGQTFHFIRARALLPHTMGRTFDKEFIAEIIEHITDFSVRGIGEDDETNKTQ